MKVAMTLAVVAGVSVLFIVLKAGRIHHPGVPSGTGAAAHGAESSAPSPSPKISAEGQMRLREVTVNTATIGARTLPLIRAETIDGLPDGTGRFGGLMTSRPGAPLSVCFQRGT